MDSDAESAFTVAGFFSERELHVSAKNATEFYSCLSETLAGLTTFQHNNLGVLSTNQPSPAYFYRGQADARWGLSSTLHRLYWDRFPKGYDTQAAEVELAAAERRVLSRARNLGLIRGLSALELLTVLQHHGTPTRLLDVTTDWRVALFFALDDAASDGRLFIISHKKGAEAVISSADTSEQADELYWWSLDSPQRVNWNRTVTPILLPYTDARMIAQRGFFLVGGLVSSREGHSHYRGRNGQHRALNNAQMREVSSLAIELPNLPGDQSLQSAVPRFVARATDSQWDATCLTIRIPAELKAGLREQLSAEGIFNESVYPPLANSRAPLAHVAAPRP